MDPNACLEFLLSTSAHVLEEIDGTEGAELSPGQRAALAIDAGMLAEHIEALDQWIRNGGGLPSRWAR